MTQDEEPQRLDIGWEFFRAGYHAALNDLNGQMTWQRTGVIFADIEAAAANAYEDPKWLDPYVAAWLTDHREPAPSASTVRKDRQPGIVYVFRDVDREMVKIGWTGSNVAGRQRALEKAGGCTLELVAQAPGTLADEKALHEHFADERAQGEWFHISDRILAWLEPVTT